MSLQIIFGILAGILLFLSNIVAYVVGVKHGRVISSGGIPNLNPVKAYNDKKDLEKSKVEFDKFTEGLNNIMNYGEPFKKVVK